MKHFISFVLYIIVLLTWQQVKDYEPVFIFLAWGVGYYKEAFDPKNYE